MDVNNLIKAIIEKLFKPTNKPSNSNSPQISYDRIEELVEVKIKEHAATLEPKSTQIETANSGTEEDYKLSPKQRDYALSLLAKVNNEFELAIDPEQLTVKDLNRLIAYNRYKNKGTLINLVKKGVLRQKKTY